MSLQHNQPVRAPEMTTDARLADLHTELVALIESKSQQAVQVAHDYCALAALLENVPAQAQGHYLLAQTLMLSSELRIALDAANTAVAFYACLDDQIAVAEAETLSGKIYLGLGEFDDSEKQLRNAIQIAQSMETTEAKNVYASALNHLAGVQFNRGDTGEALLSLETAFKTRGTTNDSLGQANCLINIGTIQNSLGQYHKSIETLGKAYDIYKLNLQDSSLEGFILHSLAWVHYSNKDFLLAIDVAQAALTAAKISQDGILITTALLNLGTFCIEGAQLDLAKIHLTTALKQSREIGYRVAEQSTLDSLGMLYQKTDRLSEAREAFFSALTLALELEDSQGEVETRLHLGSAELTLGNSDAAHEQLTLALALATESESPKEEAEAHRLLADLAQQQGDYRRAFEHSQSHLRIKDELFNTERDRQTRNLSIQFEVERARHDADVYRVRTEVEQEARLAAEQLVQERTADLARAQHEVVTRLAMAAEYRDDTTGEHTRRVGRTTARIARALGWSEDRAKILGIAARLHDVGKIGIPDAILLKPGRLTDAEFEQMKTHTLIGSRILSGGRSELLRLAEEIALSHHERWDGNGYPRGLTGEQIPLTGRIVALADVFDALTQARPYKRAWTPEKALAELKTLAGSHFDPLIVETALRVLAPTSPSGSAGLSLLTDDVMLDEEDASHILSVFEQLLVERSRDLEEARLAAVQTAQEMERMAYVDSLTGLPNRRAFESDLEDAFGRERSAPCVISFDLDGLKAANDTHGHGLGDTLLQHFAGSLEQHFAAVGRAYRIGGDEFAVIGTQVQDDRALTALLRAALEQARAQGVPQLSASMGVARAPGDARTPGDLLRESDRRMYADKLSRRAGR